MRVEKYYYSDANKPESDIQNTEKFQSFTQLSASSQSLAREIGANLFMDTDDHAGWITFICDVLSFKGAAKQAMQQLADVADEVTIRASVDTGANSPADRHRSGSAWRPADRSHLRYRRQRHRAQIGRASCRERV